MPNTEETSFNLLVLTDEEPFKDIEINESNFKKNIYLSSEDKNNFKTIINNFNHIKKTYLSSTNEVVISKINNIHNERIELTTTLENITTVGEKVKSKIKELENFEKIIKEKLENKKINAFKNFIIRFFTFGKTNINKNIKNEIWNFKVDCLEIKNNLRKDAEILENSKNEFLLKIEERHTLFAENERKVAELEKQLQEENKKIKEQLTIAIKNKEKVVEENNKLQKENEQYKQVQEEYNQKSINQFNNLNKTVQGNEEIIIFLREQIKELGDKLKDTKKVTDRKNSTDSGNESSPETNQFNKEQVNNQNIVLSSNARTRLLNIFRK